MAKYTDPMYIKVRNDGSKTPEAELVDENELSRYTDTKLYKILKITRVEPVTITLTIS
jgi:hypothetical protein